MGQADYRYVEFASRRLRGFRNRIVDLKQVPEMVRACGATDCYSGVFLHSEAAREYLGSNAGSISGYHAPVFTRVVYIDLDGDAGDLDSALTTARELVAFTTDRLGADEKGLYIFFSGKRGVHLGLDMKAFGNAEPSQEFPDVLQRLVGKVVERARVTYPSTVDMSVTRRLSLIRLPNTIHSSSGLYKTPLSLDELMSLDADGVRKLAGSPRELVSTDPTGLVPMYDVEASPEAQDLFAACQENVAGRRSCELPAPEAFLSFYGSPLGLCDAETVLFHEGSPAGGRSWTALRLASRMRCAGYAEDEAAQVLADWNSRNRPPMEAPEVNRIVGVAYRVSQPYQFGCGTGRDDAPATRLVYEACPYEKRSECRVYGGFREHVKEPVRVRCPECETQ